MLNIKLTSPRYGWAQGAPICMSNLHHGIDPAIARWDGGNECAACQPGGKRVRGIPRRWVCLAGLLTLFAVFMFVDGQVPPIIIWDESRLAVNAFEMYRTGWSLVTTYGFMPDLWNTKPPLMIWLMTLSLHVFGPSELALRLPSMIAGLGTLAIVFTFVRANTKSLAAASIAVVLLGTSVGFYGEHGARTADYDALLCFFTTAYLALLFRSLHLPRPRWTLLFACGALIAAAVLTKTVAGILPGMGAVAYAFVMKRQARIFLSYRYVLMGICALLPLALFYMARESIAPGYLDAVFYNDAIGRSSEQLDSHRNPPWFYAREVFLGGLFSLGILALLAPVAIRASKGRARLAAIFALCCFLSQFIGVSIVATRLHQYILPGLPWLAIACAIGIHAQGRKLLAGGGGKLLGRKELVVPLLLVAVAAANMVVRTGVMRYDLLLDRAYYPQAMYGDVLKTLHNAGETEVLVIEPGIDLGDRPNYIPQLRYYALVWQTRGLQVDRLVTLPERLPARTIASCDPETGAKLLALGGASIGRTGCSALSATIQ